MNTSLRTGRDPGSHTGSCRGNRGVLRGSKAEGEHLLQISCYTHCKSKARKGTKGTKKDREPNEVPVLQTHCLWWDGKLLQKLGNFSKSWHGTRGSLPTLRVSVCKRGTKNNTQTPLPNQPPCLVGALQVGEWQREPGKNGDAPPAATHSHVASLKATSQHLCPTTTNPYLGPLLQRAGSCMGDYSLQNLGTQVFPGKRIDSTLSPWICWSFR